MNAHVDILQMIQRIAEIILFPECVINYRPFDLYIFFLIIDLSSSI